VGKWAAGRKRSAVLVFAEHLARRHGKSQKVLPQIHADGRRSFFELKKQIHHMYLTLLSEPRCRRCDGLVAHRLAIWPSVLLLFVLSGVQSAQNRQPLSGTVTTESGQPLSGVTIYGTSSKCCPYKREDSKTDKSGNFRIQHPGAVLHFFKDNLQPKTILLRPEESAIQITLLPASNNLNIPVCGKQVAGVKRIGWGEYGLKFDVTERRVRIPGGSRLWTTCAM
jgi:glutaredoxin